MFTELKNLEKIEFKELTKQESIKKKSSDYVNNHNSNPKMTAEDWDDYYGFEGGGLGMKPFPFLTQNCSTCTQFVDKTYFCATHETHVLKTRTACFKYSPINININVRN